MGKSKLEILIEAADKGAGRTAKETAKSFQDMADEVTRAGHDLSGLESELERMSRTLKASTAENARAAVEAEKVWRSFEKGEISAQDAAQAIDKLQAEIKGVADAQQEIQKAPAKSSSMFWTELSGKINVAQTAITAFMESARQIYEFGKAGAVVDQTARSFDTLLQKINASPDLLNQLRAASGGTVDDMSLMSSTAALLAGTQGDLATSLADATPRLIEIAKAAGKLNPALGDTTFLYESLALGIKRAQPDILDNLGLTIKIGDANQEYANQLGKTVEELSATEKQQALLNATLEAGNVLIQQAGGDAKAATDDYQRFETAIKNFGDAAKKSIGDDLGSVLPTLTGFIEYSQNVVEATEEEEFTFWRLVPPLHAVEEAVGGFNKAQEDAYNAAAKMGWDATGKRYEAMARSYKTGTDIQQTALENVNGALMASQQYFAAQSGAAELAARSIRIYGNSLNEVDINTVLGSMRDLTQEMIFQKAAQDLDSSAALGLARSMGVLNEGAYEVQKQLAELKKKYDSNKDGLIDAAEAAAGYTDQVAELARLYGIVTDKEVTLTFNLETNFSGSGGGTGIGQQEQNYGVDLNGNGVIGAQRGADFRVPPGYPNDSFPMLVSSGEHVKVTPAGTENTSNDNRTVNIVINVSGDRRAGEAAREGTLAGLRAAGLVGV